MDATLGIENMKKIAGLKMYGVAEVSKMLGISTKTVLKHIADGALPARKIGKGYFVTEEKLRAFVENNDEEEAAQDDDDVSIVDRVVSPQGNHASDGEVPYVSLTMESAYGNHFVPGTVLEVATPFYIVTNDFRLVPLDADGAPTAFWDEDEEEVAELFAEKFGTDDDEEDEEDDAEVEAPSTDD
jgi:excisionase family DNA binding protein